MNEFLKGTRIGRIGKKAPFSLQDIPDLSGKVAVVTGATTGLGKQTAIALASKNATVVIAARRNAPGEPAVEDVLKEIRTKGGVSDLTKIDFLELDLASLNSVDSFVKTFHEKYNTLDILVNNAGVSLAPYLHSADGLELHFAVNHLGHFSLTTQLTDLILRSSDPRIVVVSSRHHHDSYEEGVRLTIEDINKEEGYEPSKAYGHSKLCNVLFALELDRRLNAEGQDPIVSVNIAHPGFVNAPGITRYLSQSMGKGAYYAGKVFMKLVALSLETGALTQIFLATSSTVKDEGISGEYFGPVAEVYSMAEKAGDTDLAARLWAFSEMLISEKRRS